MRIKLKLYLLVLLLFINFIPNSVAFGEVINYEETIPWDEWEVLCDIDPTYCEGTGGGSGSSWHSLCRVYGGRRCDFEIPEGYSTIVSCEAYDGSPISLCRGPYHGASCIVDQADCTAEELGDIATERDCACSSRTECDPTSPYLCLPEEVEGFNLCEFPSDPVCGTDFWCGDGECSDWENYHNCIEDCPVPGNEDYGCGNGAICTQTTYTGGSAGYSYTRITDALGNFVRSMYDKFGNMVESDLGGGVVTNYDYDTMGNLLKIVDANGRDSTINEYNTLGQLTWTYNIHSGEREFEYDLNGNLKKIKVVQHPNNNPEGNTFLYIFENFYDSLNRLDYIEKDGEKILENIYDDCNDHPENYAIGRLCSSVNEIYGTEIHYSYDAKGNTILVQEIFDGSEYTTEYDYDLVGNIVGVKTLYDNIEVGYRYNLLGQLEFIDLPDESVSYEYNTDGSIDFISYPNGIVNFYGYNSRNWVDRITIGINGQDPIFDEEYSYDDVGNLIRIQDWEAGIDDPYGLFGTCSEFFYDDLYRLDYTLDRGYNCAGGSSNWGHYYSNPSSAGVNLDYEYDNVGNRLNRVVDGYEGYVDDTSYVYGEDDKLDQTTDADGTICDYDYDDVGNMVKKSCEDKITIYSYDVNNMMDRIDLPDSGGVLEFTYDPLGRRVKKIVSVPGEDIIETIYIYGLGINPLLENSRIVETS